MSLAARKRNYEFYIICIDDDQSFLDSMRLNLSGKFDDNKLYSYTLLFVNDPLEGIKLIDELLEEGEEIALIIADQMMPNIKGIDFLRQVNDKSPDTMHVLLTGYAGMESAVDAINENILDKYLSKPIADREDLLVTLKHLLNEFHLKQVVSNQQDFLIELYEFSNSLNSLTSLEETLEKIINFTAKALQCERMSILLMEGDKLKVKSGLGISPKLVNSLEIPVGEGVAGMVMKDQKAVLVKNIHDVPWLQNLINPDYDSFVSAPLIYAQLNTPEQTLGVINATNKNCNRPFDDLDLKAFTFIANTASIAINNQLSRQILEKTYYNTITSLGTALEARDAYTKGHSLRVMEYSVAIAEQMGFSKEKVDIIRKASVLHDIGKIGIKDSVLLKPGRLTAEEFDEIKKHPCISESIIKPINFLDHISGIVRHHHEKVDGSGYPDGLVGNTIPIESRIMAVADAYDAMTSCRAYRKAQNNDYVMSELSSCSGSQFDKECVEAFLEILESGVEFNQYNLEEEQESVQSVQNS